MTNKLVRLSGVILCAVALSSAASHLLAAWLGISDKTAAEPFTVGDKGAASAAYLAGSSLASYGVAWGKITEQFSLRISTWGIGGSSPVEWEQFQTRAPDATTSFVVVSAYDLDEGMICDVRAELVPIRRSMRELWEANCSWNYSKGVLSSYPVYWFRYLYPTLGRSRNLMGKMRERAKELIRSSSAVDKPELGPRIHFGEEREPDEYKMQRITDWSQGQMDNKIAAMRTGFQVPRSFDGPKKHSLLRMLRYAEAHGRTFVVVLPVSETYTRKLLSTKLEGDFDQELLELRTEFPKAEWLDLRKVDGLAEDANFCDLVHMNYTGQGTVTATLLARLNQSPSNR